MLVTPTLVGKAAGPVLFLQDLFAGSAGTDLTAHTPDIGGAYSNVSGFGNGVMSLDGTNGVKTNPNDASGATNYRNAATPPSADYTVKADIKRLSSLDNQPAICGHQSTSALTFYRLEYNPAAAQWRLARVIAGVATGIGTNLSDTIGVGVTRTVLLTFVGDTQHVEVVGIGTIDASDTNIPAAGKVGLANAGNATADATGIHILNLSAY